MKAAARWTDYTLLDASQGERLERFGSAVLIRPDPQVLWASEKSPLWKKADARYHRSHTGGGRWEFYKPLPPQWTLTYPLSGAQTPLRFQVKPMGFKHTGLFPEQAVNWDWMAEKVREAGRPVRALNLFGYTGCATLALASAGAEVTHVDASKGMVAWGRENAALSGLSDRPIRWLTDDCIKFVRREQRRGRTYDAIVMDPPSYGRGPGGEVWKLEDQIYGFLKECVALLSEDPLFVVLNSYTAGLSPSVMQYMLDELLTVRRGGKASCDEIGLPVSSTGRALPCGSTAIWQR